MFLPLTCIISKFLSSVSGRHFFNNRVYTVLIFCELENTQNTTKYFGIAHSPHCFCFMLFFFMFQAFHISSFILILPVEAICVPKEDFFHLDIHILNIYLEKKFVVPGFMQISLHSKQFMLKSHLISTIHSKEKNCLNEL